MTARERKRPRRTNERTSETRKDEVIDSAGWLDLLGCFLLVHILTSVITRHGKYSNYDSSTSHQVNLFFNTERFYTQRLTFRLCNRQTKSLLTRALAFNINFASLTAAEEIKLPQIPNRTIVMSIDTWYIIAPKWFGVDKSKHRITGDENKIQFDPHRKLTQSVWNFAKIFIDRWLVAGPMANWITGFMEGKNHSLWMVKDWVTLPTASWARKSIREAVWGEPKWNYFSPRPATAIAGRRQSCVSDLNYIIIT